MKINFLLLCFILVCFSKSLSQKKDLKKDSLSIEHLNEVIITSKKILGSKLQARNFTGSAYYIAPQEIKKMGYTDINRILKAVPGVNVYEEDGYGLRPNISLRGTKAERSSKITLMEDGVLAAPAPYSAPAAYYFPNAARMSAVEVLKGNSQVQYGPFTTGGAINMVSTEIPKDYFGKVVLTYGVNNTLKTHLNFGETKKHFGYLVEYLKYKSDGFKKFEDGKKAGFNRNDFITKFSLKTDKKNKINHLFELKYGFADEKSDETYVGLSIQDFNHDPFLRYVGSDKDQMKTKHSQLAATYIVQFSPKIKTTTVAYYNTFFRNWYKLNSVKIGLTTPESRSITQILQDPVTNVAYFNVLTGKQDSKFYYSDYNRLKDNPGLFVRANHRNYYSKGIQTKTEFKVRYRKFKFENEIGLRYHFDQEDRNQWEDLYQMKSKKMVFLWHNLKGSQANKIVSAKALATYVISKLKYKKLTTTFGLRYENIELHEKDYTTADIRRTGHKRIETTNQVNVVIPSLGVNYKLSRSFFVFSGIHKGFSPPGVSKQIQKLDKNYNLTTFTEKQKPEISTNLEVGLRFSNRKIKSELIGFYNDFSNMLGSDLAASGGSGSLIQFNVGKAVVKGAEFLIHYQPFSEDNKIKLPLQISYTFTDTEMKNSFQSNSWGQVFSGDEIPYINKHALNVSVGFNYSWLEANLGIKYNGDVRTEPGQGKIANRLKVPSQTIIDATLNAKLNSHVKLTLKGINLTDKKYLVSRHPSGLRPGHPIGFFGGVNLTF